MPDAAMILSSGLPRRRVRRFARLAVRSPSVVGFHHVGRLAPVRGLSPPVWTFTKPRMTAMCLLKNASYNIHAQEGFVKY